MAFCLFLFFSPQLEILVEEEQLEAEYQRQKALPLQPKEFTGRFNLSLYDTVESELFFTLLLLLFMLLNVSLPLLFSYYLSCCDSHIVGCYAPGQVHCEKPVEIGLRFGGGFLSIYSQPEGVELENSEIIFTDQGLYVYKAYSNGHVYDTSKVWLSLFKTLLSPPYQVPAIIIPRGFPNFLTYELLSTYVPPELTGSLLSWKKDYYDNTEIYLDFTVERIKGGFDILLTADNLLDLTALIQGTELDKSQASLTKSWSFFLFLFFSLLPFSLSLWCSFTLCCQLVP